MTSTAQPTNRPRKVKAGKLTGLLLDSAIDSAVNAFLMLLLGNVALAIVGKLFEKMAPSLPPGVVSSNGFKAGVSHDASMVSLFWSEHRFLILFSGLFVLNVSLGLARHASRDTRRLAARFHKINRRLQGEWFELIVFNAFGALIAATIATWVQQSSITAIIWAVIGAPVGSMAHGIGAYLFGARATEALGNWFSWYGANQFRFTFWAIYVASVCDDLGLPNVKTLARLLWRKVTRPKPKCVPEESAPEGALQ